MVRVIDDLTDPIFDWLDSFPKKTLAFALSIGLLLVLKKLLIGLVVLGFIGHHLLKRPAAGMIHWWNEIIVITGGSHGIGYALAQTLAKKVQPKQIILLDIKAPESLPEKTKFYQCDVSKPAELLAIKDKIKNEIGIPTIIVNNAGIVKGKAFKDLEIKDFEHTIQVNLLGPMYVVKAFLPDMLTLDRGHIVNIASVCGHVGSGNMTDYCASKHGLVGFSESLRQELNALESNIKISVINPGLVLTGMFTGVEQSYQFLTNPLHPQKVVDAVFKALKSQVHNEVYLPLYTSLATKLHRFMGPHLSDFAMTISKANDDVKKFKYSKSALDSKKGKMYHRPENALKRSEDLIAVGQDAAAAIFLHETILSRKIRSSPLNVVEPIMKKFVHLCVDQRKSKMLKEGLHQYKNISQNVTVSSIEEVLSQCISLSQQKLEEAQSKADQVVIESIEDLDADTVLITGETKDRTDRELVTPWMKFLWDAYRTALDILRNNVRLETLYQSTANQAFQFCLKYARKNEFRRLCELIRQHLAVAAKHGNQTYAINLTDPDTLQRHLDTRFVQLNIASELELWQEAFRSIEDIRQLLTLGQRSPKPFILANYYEKMASIFLVGQNNLFHAAAFGGYFSVVKEHKTIKSDELERLSTTVVLAILAAPVVSEQRFPMDNDEQQSKNARFCSLLNTSVLPSRKSLIKRYVTKETLSDALPEARELFDILENKFQPLTVCKLVSPLLKKLSSNELGAKYVTAIQTVILSKVVLELSKIFSYMKLSTFIKIATFDHVPLFSAYELERFLMVGCQKGHFSLRLDHEQESILFTTSQVKPEHPSGASDYIQDPAQTLVQLAKRLKTAYYLIASSVAMDKQQALVRQAKKQLAEEQKEKIQLRELIEKKKEEREKAALKRDQELQKERFLKQQKEQAAEKARLAEESKRRELERLAQHRAEVEREEARKLAETISKELNIKMEELENLDVAALRKLQEKAAEKERHQTAERLKSILRKADHLERAFRKEELKLLDADYEKQKEKDAQAYEDYRKSTLEAARRIYERGLAMKQKALRMLEDYNVFKAKADEVEDILVAEEEARRAEEKAQRQKEEEERKARQEEELRLKKEKEEEERAARAALVRAPPVAAPSGDQVYKRGQGLVPASSTDRPGTAAAGSNDKWRSSRAPTMERPSSGPNRELDWSARKSNPPSEKPSAFQRPPTKDIPWTRKTQSEESKDQPKSDWRRPVQSDNINPANSEEPPKKSTGKYVPPNRQQNKNSRW